MHKQYCYTLLDKDGKLLYIGRTDDVAKRMRGHEDITEADTIWLTECSNEYEVKYVEAALINHYEPPYNSIIPTMDKVLSHLNELNTRYPESEYAKHSDPEHFPVNHQMPLSQLSDWARRHVSTKHQVAVYLDDDEYEALKAYCGGRAMAAAIKDLLDKNVLHRRFEAS